METTISMVRVQSYLPKSLLEELRLVAVESRTSLAEVIRMAAASFVKVSSKVPRKSGASVLLKNVPKVGFDGPRNLASQIDKYLYE